MEALLPVREWLTFWHSLTSHPEVALGLRMLAERRAEESTAGIEAAPMAVRSLARTAWQSARAPMTVGNLVDVLIDGAQVYPAQLAAIEGAQRSVDATYYSFS